MIELDHLAVAGSTLDEAAAAVEDALGVPLEPGGAHETMGTHNRLLSLGPGVYLEVIAKNPAAPAPPRPRWFDLDHFEGRTCLHNWILRATDLSAALRDAPSALGIPTEFQRGQYRWTMTVPPDGRLPYDDAAPALMQWNCATQPSSALIDRGCRLRRLCVHHPRADELLAEFPALRTLALVDFETSESPALMAEFDTPHGVRWLT